MDDDISLEEELESPAAASTAPTARWLRLERSAKQRLSGLRVVLEDLCDPGNRAAILRSVEAFGLLHVHEICGDATLGRRKAQQSSARGRSIVNGAEKWLNLHQHQDVEECIRTLQAAGFGVWAAVPPSRGTEDAELPQLPLDRLPFETPTALLFGSEARGVSASALSMCNGRFTVPLSGLSESLNVSVCVAVCVHYGALQRRKTLETGQTSDMRGEEVNQLLESYADRSWVVFFGRSLYGSLWRSVHKENQ